MAVDTDEGLQQILTSDEGFAMLDSIGFNTGHKKGHFEVVHTCNNCNDTQKLQICVPVPHVMNDQYITGSFFILKVHLLQHSDFKRCSCSSATGWGIRCKWTAWCCS